LNTRDQEIVDIANSPKPSDAELFLRYRETQSKEVVGALFRKHMSLVFGVCVNHLGEKIQAQRATMGVFDRLLTTAHIPEHVDFRTFLFALTDKHCEQLKAGEQVTPIKLSTEEVNAYRAIHRIDEADITEADLKAAAKKLKDPLDRIFKSFYLDERSYMEIAKLEKTNVSAVKALLERAKEVLDKTLAN